jgi:hypothetical protein
MSTPVALFGSRLDPPKRSSTAAPIQMAKP